MTDGRPAGLLRWNASERFKAMCRAHMRALLAARWAGPKCGAKRRKSSEACKMWAMPNGRCWRHGGKSPKGEAWHRLQKPAPGSKREAAVTRKLKIVEARRAKAAKARSAKLAAMTPAERELFEKRSAAMRGRLPGPKSGRVRQQQERKNAAWCRELLARPEHVTGSTGVAAERPQAKKSKKASAKPPLAAPTPTGAIDWRTYREGVFG